MAFVDITGIEQLRTLKEDAHERGTQLAFMEIHLPVRQVMDSSGFTEELDQDLIFHKRGDAYVGLFERIDHDYCRNQCPYALFNECHTVKACKTDDTPLCEPPANSSGKDS